jgi:2,4-dienoyl-CoA reductase-like NADH-dependent reductase (Old Yellow Enzyme family)
VKYPNLFSPLQLKGITIPNRIFSTGHDTDLGRHGFPTDALIAYQRARAMGGAGLIVVQVVAVHDTARYTAEVLVGTSDDCIRHFKRLFDAIRAEGTRAFVQLFHPGRELLGRRNGVAQVAYSASWSPTERFRIVPRALRGEEVVELVKCYGATARRMAEAGADGVEIVASHGYLPAQFLSPTINRREDEYGGSFENRLRFMRDIARAVRCQAPAELILGTRISADEYDPSGFANEDALAVCEALQEDFDYFNVIAGTSASSSGAVHIAPPMTVKNGYLAPFARQLKIAIGKAVFVAGRINQPQEAEQIIAQGAADMCGMTRAMICDPNMPRKARAGRTEDIRACIGCNQACIGHAQLGLSVSCIQYPESGRELLFGTRPTTKNPRTVVVIGGGPAGMKAAAVAAEIGHHVTLFEASSRLGGQANLAQLLPHRSEFGGIVTNLARELELSGATVRLNSAVTAELLAAWRPDVVIVATGSVPALPPFERDGDLQVALAADVISGQAMAGGRVVVYDWLADWIGAGIAEKLAGEGCRVTLAVNGVCAAANIQNYVRDAAIARLHKLGVETLPFMRLYGTDNGTVYFLHTASHESVVLDGVETLVVASPNRPTDELAAVAGTLGLDTYLIGDALAPRTAEEAVFDGLSAAMDFSSDRAAPVKRVFS